MCYDRTGAAEVNDHPTSVAGYYTWHELRNFVSQTALRVEPKVEIPKQLYKFEDDVFLASDEPADRLPSKLLRFIRDAARFVEHNQESIKWKSAAGPALDGFGLERQIIANEISIHKRHPADVQFVDDIIGILSFFSQTSQRRYEKAMPQLTVAYHPDSTAEEDYGQLGKPILDEYRALLKLCKDAHTVIVVRRGLIIANILDDVQVRGKLSPFQVPVPPRLAHLQQLSLEDKPLVFNLNPNATQEIMVDGNVVFRFVNGAWKYLLLDEALHRIRENIGACGSDDVALNYIMLALDLSDHGEGALLYLCDEPTTEVLETLFHSDEGLIRAIPGLPFQELTVRTRFTQLIGKRGLGLSGKPYSEISPLLRDLCGIDGCTIFSYSGQLLGFGCIARQAGRADNESQVSEGARTAAAKHISRNGMAIKVSTDGTATLYVGGKEWGILW